MALMADDVADLIAGTQRELGRLKWTDLSYTRQRHLAMPQLLKDKKVQYSEGTGHQFNMITDHNHAARNVGLADEDDQNFRDTLVQGYVPWRFTTTDYGINEIMMQMNSGGAQIVNYVKSQRHQGLTSLADLLETDFWGTPTSSSDTKVPFGVKYWLQSSASQGFNGTNPSGFSDGCAGVSSSTYSQHANYTDQWTEITRGDLIRKMRRAEYMTDFKAPVESLEYTRGSYDRGIYVQYDTRAIFEERAEDQNDNLGSDIASKDGRTIFRGHPIVAVPELDDDTYPPVLFIDWSVMYPVFLKGWYMKETPPIRVAGLHNWRQIHIDLVWNLICFNRRRHAYLICSQTATELYS